MSLIDQISALASRIASEFKAIRSEISSISGQSGVPVYVQQTQPTGPAIWYKTDATGTVIDILKVD